MAGHAVFQAPPGGENLHITLIVFTSHQQNQKLFQIGTNHLFPAQNGIYPHLQHIVIRIIMRQKSRFCLFQNIRNQSPKLHRHGGFEVSEKIHAAIVAHKGNSKNIRRAIRSGSMDVIFIGLMK